MKIATTSYFFVRQPNFKMIDGFQAKANSQFTKQATLAIGKLNLYKDESVTSRKVRTMTCKNKQLEVMEGNAKVQRDKKYAVLRRSGAEGVLFDQVGRDPNMTTIAPPPTANNVDKVYQVALAMGKLAFGVARSSTARSRVLSPENFTSRSSTLASS